MLQQMAVDIGTEAMIKWSLANRPANRVSYNDRGFSIPRNLTVSVSTEAARNQHELRLVAITSLRAVLAVSVFIYSFIFERPANLMNTSIYISQVIPNVASAGVK